MLCLAFFDKVNCKQITNIVWPLSSRGTVNQSLTKRMSLRHRVPFRTGELPVDNLGLEIDSRQPSIYGAFECGRIYRVYEFRLVNNVLVSSQLVFTSRELVTKKAAPVSDLRLVSIIACTRSRR